MQTPQLQDAELGDESLDRPWILLGKQGFLVERALLPGLEG